MIFIIGLIVNLTTSIAIDLTNEHDCFSNRRAVATRVGYGFRSGVLNFFRNYTLKTEIETSDTNDLNNLYFTQRPLEMTFRLQYVCRV